LQCIVVGNIARVLSLKILEFFGNPALQQN
jgi:hypothetical protein